MCARELIATVLALLLSGLAAAGGIEGLPGDVLAAVEVAAPAERLDTLTMTTAWEGLGDLLATLGRFDRGHGAPTRLAALVASWPDDVVLRDHVRTLAGRRMVVAAFPAADPPGVGWVVALEGEGGDEAVAALSGLAPRLGVEARPVAHGWIALIRGLEGPLALGRQAGAWVVLGPPGSTTAVERLARELGGEGSSPCLGDAPDFREAMARVPASAHVRGFVRPSTLAAELVATAADDPPLRALGALVADCDALGFGRSLGPDRFEAWAAARVPDGAGGPLARLVRTLTPLGSPLSGLLPDEAMLAWDLGVPPRAVAVVAGRVLEAALPAFHGRLVTLAAELHDATGVDPVVDILGRLRPGLAVGLLPPDADDRWQRPRPVAMAAVGDGPPMTTPLAACARWLAGAVAGLTEGLASAAVRRDLVDGVEMTGLVLEGVVGVPLPSPAAAVVDGVLVLSPSSSAAREVVVAIRARAGGPAAEVGPAAGRLRADAGGLARALAGMVRAAGGVAPRVEHAAEAERVAAALERVGDGSGDLRAEARIERAGGDAWLLAHADLELR